MDIAFSMENDQITGGGHLIRQNSKSGIRFHDTVVNIHITIQA